MRLEPHELYAPPEEDTDTVLSIIIGLLIGAAVMAAGAYLTGLFG